MRNFFKHSGQLCALGALLLLGAPVFLSSCKEEIDESNFAIKKMQTAADYIDENSQFSLMNALFRRVRLGNVEGASPLHNMLSARGNYTIFLPTNEAVEKYMAENGIDFAIYTWFAPSGVNASDRAEAGISTVSP